MKKLHGVKSFNWHWRHWIFPALAIGFIILMLHFGARMDIEAAAGKKGMTYEEYLEEYGG